MTAHQGGRVQSPGHSTPENERLFIEEALPRMHASYSVGRACRSHRLMLADDHRSASSKRTGCQSSASGRRGRLAQQPSKINARYRRAPRVCPSALRRSSMLMAKCRRRADYSRDASLVVWPRHFINGHYGPAPARMRHVGADARSYSSTRPS